MATPFETYIQTELPLRSATLLPAQCGGYDGDPNLGGAPAILQNAPVGTFYWETTAEKFWRKKGGPGEWSEEGGGGGGGVTTYATEIALLAAAPAAGTIGYATDTQRYWFRGTSGWKPKANLSVQLGALVFAIDYTLGTDPVAGTVFCRQSEIDAYLLEKGQTYFKTIMGCFRCLPDIVTTYVYFYLQPGIHRPLQPITEQYQYGHAFPFKPLNNLIIGETRYPLIFGESARIIFTPPVFNAEAAWEIISAAQACTGASTSGSPGNESYLDFAGANFTVGALKGYFVRIPTATPQIISIRDNSATRVFLNSNYSGSPSGLNIPIVSPATIIRNSLDDINPAYASDTMFGLSAERWELPNNTTRFNFESIRFDQFATSTSSPGTFNFSGGLRVTLGRCLFDHARLKNSFVNAAGTTIFQQGAADTQFAIITLTQCNVRGNRLATVPASGSVPFSMGLSPQRTGLDSGAVYLAQCYLGGCNGVGSPIQINNCLVQIYSTMFDDFGGGFITVGYCWLNFLAQTPRTFFKGGATSIAGLGRIIVNAVFESITGTLVNVTSTDAFTSDVYLGYSANGPGGGAVSARQLVFGNNAKIIVFSTWAVTATGLPEISNGSGNGFSMADLRAKWEVYTQIQATLATSITVLAISTAVSTSVDKACTIKYTQATKLLQFHHFNDGAGTYGANVDVTAGGVFLLKGNNAAYWCIVAVNAANLPGADATETFRVQPAPWLAHDHITLYAGA